MIPGDFLYPDAAGPADRPRGRTNVAKPLRSMAILLCTLASGCGLLTTDPSLPVYTSEQTDSAHPGFRRTTVSSAGTVYVNDLEEQVLELRNRDPKSAVGRGRWGDALICTIDG